MTKIYSRVLGFASQKHPESSKEERATESFYHETYILEKNQLRILSLWAVMMVIPSMTGGLRAGFRAARIREHSFLRPSVVIRGLSGGFVYIQALM